MDTALTTGIQTQVQAPDWLSLVRLITPRHRSLIHSGSLDNSSFGYLLINEFIWFD